MIPFLTHRWTHIVILLTLLGGAVYISGSNHDLRLRLQYATFDTFNKLRPREATDQTIIVDLDEESLVKLGQWPWPRRVMADLVTTLHDMGAKVIAFDIVFAEPDRTSPARIAQTLPEDPAYQNVKQSLNALPDNDKVFAKAISDAGNVVTGFTRARPEETLRLPRTAAAPTFLVKDKTPFFKDTFAAPGLATNLPEFSSAAAGDGSFMATPDIDGIIRNVSLLVRYPDISGPSMTAQLYPMLGLETLRVSIDRNARFVIRPQKDKGAFDANYQISMGNLNIPIESSADMWVYYRDIKPEEYISAHRFFDPAQIESLKAKIKDKIVFVGTSAEGLRDIRSTPLDIFVPGVEVHVNVVEQILQGKYLTRPDIIVGVEAFVIGLAGFLIIILAPFINVIWLALFTSAMMAGMFYGSWQMFTGMGLLLDPVYPSAALGMLFLVSSLLSYIRSEAERRQVRQAFGLYISPAFMEELTKNPDKLKLGGEVRDLSVMFTDIRGFTGISEHLSPEELIQLMNDFLTPMSDLVMENRGTIDKYMGDAMMAFWNAPLDDPDHARHACLTALKMNDALVPINARVKEKAERDGRPVRLLNAGIGINTGPCSVGNMGSRQRFAYSALGDAVNLASRLEGQTKTYGVQLMVGEDTQKKCADLAFIELDLIRVKGKEKPAKIFTLMGDAGMAQSMEFKRWTTLHNAFLAAYRAGDFDCAAQDIGDVITASNGGLTAYYAMMQSRLSSLTKNPPPEDWGGVFDAASK
jgi:adenylate cyclase